MSEEICREIGGREAVAAVVDDFYERVLADDRLVPYFEDADMAALRAHQVQFISSVLGGPVEYTGAEMRAAHADLDVGDPEFDAVAGHLADALLANGVSEADTDAILSEVEPLRTPAIGR